MTPFLSEKIFYHGWTQMHTDWKEEGPILDLHGADDRQLNSWQFASRPYPCSSVVKEKALRLSVFLASLR